MARHGRLFGLLALAVGLYSQVYAQPVESLPSDVKGELRGPSELLGAIDINDFDRLDERALGARREFPPPAILPPPQIVYRGDKRSPKEIEAIGGFLPSSEVTPTNENNGFSLYMHHLGYKLVDGKRVTAYVSTTRFFGTALGYANMASKEGGWIYEIQALPHMTDSDGTLLQGRKWRNEFEISALGGISWSQVKSAVQVPGFKTTGDYGAGFWSDVTVESFKQKMPEKQWFNNSNYNSTFDQFKASPGQPQLAGWFDSEHEQYKSQEPWSLNQTKTIEEYYMDFMNQFGGHVGWTGTYPLVLSHRALPR
ncbi:hypothetical protein CCM_08244 [Cordyceps militaris CM01]|uniref:Heat Labile Enterotoxin Type Iib n=1 Tax=Cordyceps militaris (strain CM01) TaxID=983644 RepID=G3JT54_CORMM|nr:uncharacterized protein CCM_08244 [Cordyceps militaris CM01]EGX88201.1 hypothetical protein CCM_08244 [Cordyceps militaris CM01]